MVRSSVVSRTKSSRIAAGDTADQREHFRAQAAASHAEQVDRVELLGADLLRQVRSARNVGGHRLRHVEPAEPGPNRSLVGAAGIGTPGARIPLPDSGDQPFVQEAVDEAGGR